MDVEGLLRVARHDFLDDTASPYRWSTENLIRWLNRAEEEACRRQKLLVDKTTQALAEVTLVADQPDYTLDSRVHIVEKIVWNGYPVDKTTDNILDRYLPYWRGMEPGDPMYYLQNDLTITVVPTPTTSQDGQLLNVESWRLPLNPLVNMTDVPEIPSAYHEDLVYYVAARAFMMPDEDLRDTELSADYMTMFDQKFGPALSVDVLAHKRRNKNVTYIGHAHAYHGRRQRVVRSRDPFDYE